MKIVLIGNISNGIGLERDATLLSGYLTARGHSVALQRFEDPPIAAAGSFDLSISLETVSDHLLPLAPRRWLFSNPEWTQPQWLRSIQRDFEWVFAKTHDAEATLRRHFDHVRYTGFLCADRRDDSVPRWPVALHLGGNSGYRNTNSVIAAWRAYRYWDDHKLPKLVVVSSSSETVVPPPTPGIDFDRRIESDDDLRTLQNSCLFHILPSAYEGFGHAIHESQSVGAILLTTGAGPMAELHAPFEVAPAATRKAGLATIYDVSPEAIRAVVPRMTELPSHEVARLSLNARMAFERGNAECEAALDGLLAPPAITIGGPIPDIVYPARLHTPMVTLPRALRIAILGNFGASFSTESDLAWTLGDMGHSVTPLQENAVTTDDVLATCIDRDVHLLMYVHTHGWDTPGRLSLDAMLDALHAAGVRTCSFHLDRYVGLNILDQRESRVGQHPFWRTQHVFTADGGNQDFFASRGVNHHWLPPGVIRRDCYRGTPDASLACACAIGFVGATSYHPEYPFRAELIRFLEGTYGDRFRTFQGFRGARLNDLYASVRVCVGDSCFGGSDFYWSDRVPETCGRGGFLIHPASRGLAIPGLVTFPPGDLLALADRIDYALAHPAFRAGCAVAASEWVRDHETYTNRMTTLLREVGL